MFFFLFTHIMVGMISISHVNFTHVCFANATHHVKMMSYFDTRSSSVHITNYAKPYEWICVSVSFVFLDPHNKRWNYRNSEWTWCCNDKPHVMCTKKHTHSYSLAKNSANKQINHLFFFEMKPYFNCFSTPASIQLHLCFCDYELVAAVWTQFEFVTLKFRVASSVSRFACSRDSFCST